jgi:hypothetical protein
MAFSCDSTKHRLVGQIFLRRCFACLLSLKFPRRVDDLLLEFRELLGLALPLLPLLLLLLRLRIGRLALAINLLERANLGEEHIARSAANLAIRPTSSAQEKIRTSWSACAPRSSSFSKCEKFVFTFAGVDSPRINVFRFLAADRISEAERLQPKVILRLRLIADLLQRRHTLIAALGMRTSARTLIREHVEHELRRELVRAPVGIDQLQFVALADFRLEAREQRLRFVRVSRERHDGLVLRDQPCRRDRLVNCSEKSIVEPSTALTRRVSSIRLCGNCV